MDDALIIEHLIWLWMGLSSLLGMLGFFLATNYVYLGSYSIYYIYKNLPGLFCLGLHPNILYEPKKDFIEH